MSVRWSGSAPFARHGLPLVLVVLLALAMLSRTWALDSRSMWVDEVKLVERAEGIDRSMLIQPYFNPPFAYLVFNLWMRLGSQEIFLRILPALAGVLTVVIVYQIGLLLFGRGVAALGGLFFALSPFHIYYSQEVNTYAFVALFAALNIAFYGKLLREDTRRGSWAAYVLTALLGMYTHN